MKTIPKAKTLSKSIEQIDRGDDGLIVRGSEPVELAVGVEDTKSDHISGSWAGRIHHRSGIF